MEYNAPEKRFCLLFFFVRLKHYYLLVVQKILLFHFTQKKNKFQIFPSNEIETDVKVKTHKRSTQNEKKETTKKTDIDLFAKIEKKDFICKP